MHNQSTEVMRLLPLVPLLRWDACRSGLAAEHRLRPDLRLRRPHPLALVDQLAVAIYGVLVLTKILAAFDTCRHAEYLKFGAEFNGSIRGHVHQHTQECLDTAAAVSELSGKPETPRAGCVRCLVTAFGVRRAKDYAVSTAQQSSRPVIRAYNVGDLHTLRVAQSITALCPTQRDKHKHSSTGAAADAQARPFPEKKQSYYIPG